MLKKDLNILEDIYKGIGDSPSLGFEDIRNLNINSQPGQVSLNFKTSALTLPPTVSAVAYTVVTATNVFTVSSTSGWFNGMAITLNTVVTSTGISTGRVYWVGSLSGNTFKLYKNPSLGAAMEVDVTGSDGSGTISSYTFGKPLDSAYVIQEDTLRYALILDDAGRVWWVYNPASSVTNYLVYLGNDTLTGDNGRAIAIFQGHIIVFRAGHLDALNILYLEQDTDLDGSVGWDYAFDTVGSLNVAGRRAVFTAQNNVLYFDNAAYRVGSLAENAGQTFDPVTGASFTLTDAALDLPVGEQALSFAELGNYLLIGGNDQRVYPWNKNTPSFDRPIKVPELKTRRIVGSGQLAYLFSGDSGRIYVTNGVSVQPYKKLPEQVTNQQDPLITWGDALAYDNNLYFSFSATKNDGTALTTVGGVWGIDLTTNALRLVHQASYGSYAGTTHLIIPNVLDTDSIGQGLIIPWANSTTYGVDYGSTSYYTSYSGYLISPLYRVGSVKEKTSLNELEIILDKPLAANEGVRVSFRPDRNTAFSGVTTFDYATYGAKQYIHFDFPAVDLVTTQFKVELTGTTTTPVIKDILLR